MSKIRKIRTKGSGDIFKAGIVKEDLADLAVMIKDFMFARLEATGKHKLRKTGGLVEETKVNITDDGFEINTPEYAQYIEGGRKPFAKKVPIAALIKWIKRYFIGGRTSSGKFKKRTIKVESLAFAIQNAIYKSGIKARTFLKETIEYGEQLIADYLNILTDEIVAEIEFALK